MNDDSPNGHGPYDPSRIRDTDELRGRRLRIERAVERLDAIVKPDEPGRAASLEATCDEIERHRTLRTLAAGLLGDWRRESDSPDECVRNEASVLRHCIDELEEALHLSECTLQEETRPPPCPGPVIRRITRTVKIPATLDATVEILARRDGRTVSETVERLLEHAIAGDS